jgi:hypothetical protein
MKLTISKPELDSTPGLWLKQAGYRYHSGEREKNENYVRRLGSGDFPRLHIYIKEKDEEIVFNLHLDQKKPSYPGACAHNAEYNGEIVEAEIERLKKLITHLPAGRQVTHNNSH